MSEFHIDTDLGAEAAAGLADAELQYLCQIALWELAIRTCEEDFVHYLQSVVDIRRAREPDLDAVRTQRDLMNFAAQVMADIQRLPGIDHPGGTDMYR
jgi:hypothetical protein